MKWPDLYGVFPVAARTLEEVEAFLRSRWVPMEALEAARAAWEEFSHPKRIRSEMTLKLRFTILQRDEYTCQACGVTAREERMQVDHKIAVAKGGTNHEENLWTLCWPCNIGKGTRPA